MIYATGDLHGNSLRFQPQYFPEQAKMTKDDYMIVCGDFGCVCVLGKRVQAALREQLQRQCNVPRFGFRLLQERGMEVLQCRHNAKITVSDEFPVDLRGTPVNDGFLLRRQLPSPYELFTEGQ